MINILIIFSGSVASIKDEILYNYFKTSNKYNIKLLYRKSALLFSKIVNNKNCDIIIDKHNNFDKELAEYLINWSQIILISPCSSNLLAEIYLNYKNSLAVT